MPKVTRQYLANRREHILDAATICFARKGYHATTINDICREARASHGALYRYFPAKQGIIQAICRRLAEEVGPRKDQLKQNADVKQAIDWSFLADRFETDSRKTFFRMRMHLYAEALRDREIQRLLVQQWDDNLRWFAAAIARGQEQGEINPDVDPEGAARVLALSVYMGLQVQIALDARTDASRYIKAWKAIYSGNFWTAQSTMCRKLSGHAAIDD